MTTYYAAPAGGTGAGTLGDPWSLSHALSGAGGTLGNGDTVLLRGGDYSAVAGFAAPVSGSTWFPITFDAYQSERPRFDGAIAGLTWSLHDAGTNTWKTDSTSMGTGQYFMHADLAGNMVPLVPHKNLTGLMATTQDYRSDGDYFMGPGFLEDGSGGQLYVRLADADSNALVGRAVTPFADKNPNNNDLRICTTSVGLAVSGHDLIFRRITIDDYYAMVSVTGDDVTFEECDGRFGFFGYRLNTARRTTIDGCTIDGLMDNGTLWLSWYDVKGGITNADGIRKCAIDGGSCSGARVINSTIRGIFDGFLGDAVNRMEIANNLIQCWDDAWQIYASAYLLNIHHNDVFGAGFGYDSSGSNNINRRPGTVYVHHNKIDPTQYPILWGRTGVTGGGEAVVGVKDPMAINTHGSPTTGRWPSPRKWYYNTIVVGDDIASFTNTDLFGGQTAEFQYGPAVTHDVFNNIIVNTGPLGRDFDSDSGQERMDGNVIWGQTGNTPPWRYIHTSTGLLDGESPIGSLNTLAELLASQAYTDSQVYSDGWETNGLQVDPMLDADLVPQNPLVLTGAVDLTGMGWPGTETYQPERGAVGTQVPTIRRCHRHIRHRHER